MRARLHRHDRPLPWPRHRSQRPAPALLAVAVGHVAAQPDGARRPARLSTRALRVELAALSKVKTPAILHWDLNHFVVLRSVTSRSIVIHDPALGVRTVPIAEVSKHFTGVVLELAPAANFRVVHARAPMKLSSLWSQMTGFATAFLHVLLLSIALQIAAFAAPFQIQLVIDEAVFHADQDLLTVLALAFGTLVVMQALVEALRGWTLRVFGHLLSFQIAGNLIRHMLRLPAEFFEKRHVGDMLSRIGAVQPIQEAITRGVVSSIIDGVMALVAAVVLFFYSATLAGIVVFSILLHLVLVFALFPGMRHRMEEEILARAKEQSHLMEIGAGGDHHQADGARGRARKRMAQSQRRSDQRRHLRRQVSDFDDVHPDPPDRTGLRHHHLSRSTTDPDRSGLFGRHAVCLPVVSPNAQ